MYHIEAVSDVFTAFRLIPSNVGGLGAVEHATSMETQKMAPILCISNSISYGMLMPILYILATVYVKFYSII